MNGETMDKRQEPPITDLAGISEPNPANNKFPHPSPSQSLSSIHLSSDTVTMTALAALSDELTKDDFTSIPIMCVASPPPFPYRTAPGEWMRGQPDLHGDTSFVMSRVD